MRQSKIDNLAGSIVNNTMASAMNALYSLIYERAGSKMIMDAEEIQMYITVDYFLSEGFKDRAIDVASEFDDMTYSYGYSPQRPITYEEVMKINPKDLENIPWIYVHVLETLCAGTEAEKAVNDLIKASEATKWRIPLDSGVANRDAFEHVCRKWKLENTWIDSFNSWSGRDARLGVPY